MHSFIRKQQLAITREEAWEFFSSPANLKKITPPAMKFEIRSGFQPGEKIYAGMVIKYRVCPFPGISVDWVTEITHMKEGAYFVDEQRSGPYSFWHHQHIFKETANGIEMTDIVHYKVPFGYLGKILNKLIIERTLRDIFNYRYNIMEQLYGKKKDAVTPTTPVDV